LNLDNYNNFNIILILIPTWNYNENLVFDYIIIHTHTRMLTGSRDLCERTDIKPPHGLVFFHRYPNTVPLGYTDRYLLSSGYHHAIAHPRYFVYLWLVLE